MKIRELMERALALSPIESRVHALSLDEVTFEVLESDEGTEFTE